MSSVEINQETSIQKEDEFRPGQSLLSEPISRRQFLKMMGASIAGLGLTACQPFRKPEQHTRPYVKEMENTKAGTSNYFSTSISVGAEVQGVLAEVYEGRPTKLEGHPLHPNNKGSLSAIGQGELLNLYDPDRLAHPKHNDHVKSLSEFESWVNKKRASYKQGKGLAILTPLIPSIGYKAVLEYLQKVYPNAEVIEYEALQSDNQETGISWVYNRPLIPNYNLAAANVVLSFDSDVFMNEAQSLRYTRDFSSRRGDDLKKMNRLYAFESRGTTMGTQADHRYSASSQEMMGLIWVIADRLLGVSSQSSEQTIQLKRLLSAAKKKVSLQVPVSDEVIQHICNDLKKNKRNCLVIAGKDMDPLFHAIVALLNHLLQNRGRTVSYQYPFHLSKQKNVAGLKHLVKRIQDGKIDTLVMAGGDPIYQAPQDIPLAESLKKVKHVVQLSPTKNQSSEYAEWIIPQSHALESWGDLLSQDGTVSMVQPAIAPLYESLSYLELILKFLGSGKNGHDFTQGLLVSQYGAGASSKWKTWCQDGIVYQGKTPQATALLSLYALNRVLKRAIDSHQVPELELSLQGDYLIYDGRFANNPWLQECPDPISKLTWDNALLMHPKTAEKLKLKRGDMVNVEYRDSSITAPVLPILSQAKHTVSLSLGYGQTKNGKIGSNTGVNAYDLVYSDSMYQIPNPKITPTGQQYMLAITQGHDDQQDRPLYREIDKDTLSSDPEAVKHMGTEHPPLESLWAEKLYDTGNQWGMTIDLSKCTGCQACVTACQSENNIPSVGKDGVLNGREMAWIRIDRYMEETDGEVHVQQQPVACVQCENAPCEQVCPVNATVHNDEGLNVMVYNRCIGTRYCSNNCPLKVRRFNFFDWHQRSPHAVKSERKHLFDHPKSPAPTYKLQFNPEVTVRMRGVMEKCTYCVQRIAEAKSHSQNEKREIQDGEVITACQQSCPAGAIEFGNILDKNSKVSKARESDRSYAMLEELNIKPRTLYLAAVKNPNPYLVTKKDKKESHGQHH